MTKLIANSGDPDIYFAAYDLGLYCTVCQIPFLGYPD